MSDMKTALLLGGTSPEREVSLTSGAGVQAALQALGVAPLVLDPGVQSDWLTVLIENNIERVFNILHGGSGENGDIRAALNSVGIACTGSDTLGSALAMHKDISKTIWRAQGLPTADWQLVCTAADAKRVADILPPPWFVKPAAGGSSTNASMVQHAQELSAAIEKAAGEGGAVLVEKLISGIEYTLCILDDTPLPLIKIEPPQQFYNYHAKYVSNEVMFSCPCGLPDKREQELVAQCMQAFRAIHCSGWGRVDFMLDAQGELLLLEVNTVPGMTSHSLLPLAAKQTGLNYNETVKHILQSAKGGGA